jgi:beta-mannanase
MGIQSSFASYADAVDASKSKAAYNEFFALWKDADPDTLILKEARATTRNRNNNDGEVSKQSRPSRSSVLFESWSS